jgi:NADPH-dependent curcumin reductase CurA
MIAFYLIASVHNPYSRFLIFSCGVLPFLRALLLVHHFQLTAKRVKMQGFLVNDYFGTPTEGAFAKDMPQWLKEGKIKYVEDIYEGLESSAKAFIGLLKGHNVGKVIVHVADQ